MSTRIARATNRVTVSAEKVEKVVKQPSTRRRADANRQKRRETHITPCCLKALRASG